MPKTKEDKQVYESIILVSKDFAEVVKSPVDTAKFTGTDKERYERAFQSVREGDLVIGEQSYPSTGQGMEIRECAILKKPLIVVAKEGSTISGLVKGCPILKEILYYKDITDLEKKLRNYLLKRLE